MLNIVYHIYKKKQVLNFYLTTSLIIVSTVVVVSLLEILIKVPIFRMTNKIPKITIINKMIAIVFIIFYNVYFLLLVVHLF